MNKKISINGMVCMNCVKHIKNALMEVDGINGVEVNLKEKYALIEGSKISNDSIKSQIQDAGYDVIGITDL